MTLANPGLTVTYTAACSPNIRESYQVARLPSWTIYGEATVAQEMKHIPRNHFAGTFPFLLSYLPILIKPNT